MNYNLKSKINNIYSKVLYENFIDLPYFIYFDSSNKIYVQRTIKDEKMYFKSYDDAINYILNISDNPIILTFNFRCLRQKENAV